MAPTVQFDVDEKLRDDPTGTGLEREPTSAAAPFAEAEGGGVGVGMGATGVVLTLQALNKHAVTMAAAMEPIILIALILLLAAGAGPPGAIRTPDRRIRSPMLFR